MAISEREKTAVRLFASGVNCAQAVLMTYADIAGLTQEQAARVACGLGGGIGRLRDNCGAFSSAVMLCAALEGADGAKPEHRPQTYARVQRVYRAFIARNGSICCAELLGREKKPESPTPDARTNAYYSSRPCAKIIRMTCKIIDEMLAENAAVYGAKIRGSAYLLYLFGSVGAGDWLAMLIVTLSQAALLALTLWVIARSFLKIATATGSVKKVRFEHKAVRAQSVQRALRQKELRRFTASPNYMLNCGLGIVMLPVAGIALLIKGRALAQLLDDAFGAGADIVPVLLCAALCLLASMNDMAAPSVSLEGRQLWLAQSLPVTPWQVLRAKLDTQLLLTGVPVLFCALCAVIVLPGGAVEMALAVIAALLYTLLSALAALALGLKMPNLTWTNETTPIKQSGCVMLSLFANWFYAIALGGLYFLCGRYLSAAAYLAIFAAVTAVACALLLRWLKRRGTRIFAAL